MKVLVIIPAYNEAENLVSLLDRLKETCPGYDAVVVNDNSTDNTLQVCKEHGADVIDLPANLGIGGAVQAGYRYALHMGYEAAVQLDGDGQHNPECIDKLLTCLKNGSNLCIGSRFLSSAGYKSTWLRRFAIRYFSALIYFFTGCRVTDPTSGFRACDRTAVRLFAEDYPVDYPEPESIVNAAGKRLKITEEPVVMNKRKEGKSTITGIKSLYYMVKVSMAIIISSLYGQGCREVKR
ncbi:MAG: glycosyltransferase family 2 protein [Acetivibrionales bacterium]|jgi:glycosyltransferase involved in cell wall biosynthesis